MAKTQEISFITDEDCKLQDNASLIFGDGSNREVESVGDIYVTWDGTDLDVTQGTANSAINFGVDGAGIDMKWFGDTASAYMLWDQSQDALIFAGAAGIQFSGTDGFALGDDVFLKFGASDDVTIDWNAAGGLDVLAAADNSVITFGTGTKSFDLKVFGGDTSTYVYFNADGGSGSTGEWAFGVDDHGVDVKFYGATASSYALWDESANELVFDGADLWLKDSDTLEFGDASDVVLAWDGTDLDVTAAADDSVIKFGTGTNSFDVWVYGNTANAYALWDASEDKLALMGPARPQGFNSLSERYELRWVAGQEGLPDLNATAWTDIIDARFEILGTSASADDVTYYAEGGLTFETDGADHDQVILLPHLDAAQSPWTQTTWGTDKQTHWECDISTGAAITNCIIWAGLKLTNTSTTASDNDQVFFRYQSGVNDGEWQAISSIADSDDAHDTNVVVATGTRYHLKIVIGSDRTAQMYINGALVETTAALTDAVDLIPYIGVQSEGAGEAKTLYVHGQAISRVIG